MPATLAQRDARARELGWRSYGQRRYWEARWDDELARRLAAVVCQAEAPDPGADRARRRSIMCAACNRRVNPRGGRRGDWRARLVRAAQEAHGGPIVAP